MSNGSRWFPRALAVSGWLVIAALAAGVTLATVSVLGSGIFGGSTQTMSQEEVDRALAVATVSPEPGTTSPGTTSPPAPTGTSAPSSTIDRSGSDPTVVSSAGGRVIARCTGPEAEVLSWTPAQGFRTKKVELGPAPDVRVEFESDDRDVKVELRCEDGNPTAVIDDDGDDD
ncbi:MAG TPA: hypothetical protein VFG96_03325 [Jiangellaceae bacterium]|nr:hypothetical protein [Jiangellaceae bacterium]